MRQGGGWEGDCAGDGRAHVSASTFNEFHNADEWCRHLIEAVICYHLTAEQLAHLHRRGKELSVAASTGPSTHDPSPSSTTSASPPVITGPSPSSTHSNPSPESNTSYHLPTDLLPLISSSTTSSTRATTHLLTSRHHLPLRLLRSRFPQTFGHAINSELSDEALPAPGDGLGAARKVDVDEPERFSWPIELGMVCPVAHTVAFGRCLVGEIGGGLGTGWVVKLES